MGELKAHNINDLSLHDIANCDFYFKSEVDNLIAEKDAEIAKLRITADKDHVINTIDEDCDLIPPMGGFHD